MSYSFGMYFKQVKNTEEAFDVALRFSEKFTENDYKNAEEYIKSQKMYIPSIRFCGRKENVGKDTNRFWLHTLLSFQFVFWKEHNLLGLVGYDYPADAAALFDNHICFQNSTDQDYDFDIWSDKISIFRDKKKIYQDASIDFLLTKLPDYTKGEIQKMPDYFRKSLLYTDIFETLHLNNWLYDNSDDYFRRFSIGAINSMEKEIELYAILQYICNREKPDLKEESKNEKSNISG